MPLKLCGIFLVFTGYLALGCGNRISASAPFATNLPNTLGTPGCRIAWDYSTLRRVSLDTGARYNGYARLVQLAGDTLLAVYESSGSIVAVKSFDRGNTWVHKTVVAAKQPHINMAVPDVLALHDGSILVCYNPRPVDIDTSRHFAICTRKSYDGGLSFTDERLVYQAGHQFSNGCWEPAAIQLPTGEIQLYFANEAVYTESNEQNISMLRSSDGGVSWSKTPEVVSFRPGSRDGMPSPVLLNNHEEVLISIEDNGFKNFKPYVLRKLNAATIGATSPNRYYALADSIADSLYAGAPYLRQLHTGELILSYQGTEGRVNKMNFANMKVVIGSARGNDFNRKSVPFQIPVGRSALWNSLSVLNDNTVVALTSTNAFDQNKVQVWMIKGHYVSGQVAGKASLTIDGKPLENAWNELPIFVGNNAVARVQSRLLCNHKNLYVIGKITGLPGNQPGLQAVDHLLFSVNLPGSAAPYQFKLSPKMGLGISSNDNHKQRVKFAGISTSEGYTFEMAVPWSFLGGRPPSLSYNIGLDVMENSVVSTDCISGNDPAEPKTWSVLQIEK